MVILKSICKVECIDASLLTDTVQVHGVGVLLRYFRDFEELPLASLADCQMTSAIDNNNTIYTTTLKAHLCKSFDPADRHLCFRLTAVDGTSYLLGSRERPFPTVTADQSLPGEITAKAGCTLNVTYTDRFGLMQILD